jgi:hypothetical protein
MKQDDLISAIVRSKNSMVETASNREPDDRRPNFFSAEEINEYHISTTGAKITTDSSINVLYQYCVKLSKDKYGDYILILFLFCVATHMIHIKKFETPSFYLVLFLCVEGSNSFFPNVMLY